jgi:predicted permease
MSDHEIRPGIRRLVRLALRRADRAPAEMDDEIRLHIALRTEQLVRDGMAPDDARREAERRFGALDEARPRLHDSAARREARMRWHEGLHGIRQGLTVTLRGMRRSPGFVAVAVTCIALGVGANAAAYSVFDELVLRTLPVHEPERLVRLGTPGPKLGNDQCNQAGSCEEVFSYPMFRDLQRSPNTGLSHLAAHVLFLASVANGSDAVQGDGLFVSGSYFPTLGLVPAAGRLLGPSDDEARGGHPVAVVSHAYWRTHLGADPAAVGRDIVVNGRSLTVVGVAPAGFEGTTAGVRPWVYVPLVMAADVDPFFGEREQYDDRFRYWLYVFGRLRPGEPIEQARAALTAVYRPILRDVEAPMRTTVTAATRARFLAKEVLVEDGRHGQSSLRGQSRMPLFLLFGITALVVLIACANIANLLLVRGAGRATEIAVRLSLGAGRRQLVAQLLTESVLLAILGGLASIAVAYATLRLIGSFVPPSAVGFGVSLSLDLSPSVLVFAGGVALVTGLLFGLFPALHATRTDLIAAIRAGAGQVVGGHRAAARFRTSLVTAQIALSMALLGCAGLFVKSLRNVGRVDVGMDTERVMQFALLPMLNGYPAARAHALFTRVEDELASAPGVLATSASGVPLFTGSSTGGNVRVEGFEPPPDANVNVRMNMVGPGFFRTLGIPLVAGREFAAGDRIGAPKVAIVNEAFVRKFALGRTAIGRHMRFGGDAGDALDIEIVGVVRDAGYSGIKDSIPPLYFRPYRQDSTVTAAMFYTRTSLPPDQALRAMSAIVARHDRNLPTPLLKPLSQQLRENIFLDRMIGALAAVFALLATLLAAVGLYGVLAYTVAQRTREIGVRMALGADGGRVRRLVLRQVAAMAVVGGVIGLAGAMAIGRAAESMLFRLDGRDPVVLAGAAAVLLLAALVAGWVPARRASRLSPVTALRHE